MLYDYVPFFRQYSQIMAVIITPWGKIAGQQLLFTIVNHCFLWQDHQLFL